MRWHSPERLSVVIPGFTDCAAVARLIEDCFAAAPADLLGEIIVVDDGGRDGASCDIAALMARYPSLRLLRHLKRCGTSAALRTGVRFATGELVAMLDSSGRNDPDDLIRLATALIDAGPETALASGTVLSRRPRGATTPSARVGNWLRDILAGEEAPDDASGIAVFTRRAFLDLPYFSGMHRYLPSLMRSYGHAAIQVAVEERPIRGRGRQAADWPRIIDTYEILGVRWLKSRTRIAPVSEHRCAAVDLSDARITRPAVTPMAEPLRLPMPITPLAQALEHHA